MAERVMDFMAEVVSVRDGDTATFLVDLGFSIWHKDTFRFAGIDTPELKESDGVAVRDYVRSLLPVGSLARLTVTGKDKYGRWLAFVYPIDGGFAGGESLNNHLIERGMAKSYSGGARG